MEPICKESPILKSFDVKLVKMVLKIVLTSDQQSYIIVTLCFFFNLTHYGYG